MTPSIHQIRASLGRFCLGEAIAPELSDYAPAFEACFREWKATDAGDTEDIIDFWADIVQQWIDCQSDPRPVRILTDAFGTAGPDICDSLPYLYRLVCQLAADNGGRWFEDDGLKEGRDFEFVTMLMNPATGSVAPKEEWEQDYREMSEEEWGGPDFESACLVEVVPDGSGWWKEV